MAAQLDPFLIEKAIDESETVYDWLRLLRERAEATEQQQVVEAVTKAILDIGSALVRVEKVCTRTNARLRREEAKTP